MKIQRTVYQAIDQQYTDLVKNVETYLQAAQTTLLQARNTVKIVNFNGQRYVIKSFKKPDLFMRFNYSWFRSSKAKRSFLYAQRLLKRNIATPQPIGYKEVYRYSALRDSYYISIYMPYDFSLRQILGPTIDDECAKILRAFAVFSRDLHREHIYHDDYTSSNILINKKAGGYHFVLVDLNRLKFQSRNILRKAKNIEMTSPKVNSLSFIANEYAISSNIKVNRFVTMVLFWRNIFLLKSTIKRYRNGIRDPIRAYIKKLFRKID